MSNLLFHSFDSFVCLFVSRSRNFHSYGEMIVKLISVAECLIMRMSLPVLTTWVTYHGRIKKIKKSSDPGSQTSHFYLLPTPIISINFASLSLSLSLSISHSVYLASSLFLSDSFDTVNRTFYS